ncbi:PAS domain S-box-containing protein [Nitrosomonas sp. PY1]|uniref:PAS domain S-box protein n=1 Tax=Nitrosomonas sp. PY1 TaxID=1803906 RepID=UPI001FC8DC52|nr:PAS domain S-box protein [Nitrosomonas sp. PY1]GKS69366.1 PAS domain S-box-containing protein [Nitrosomonas sp. PY1]
MIHELKQLSFETFFDAAVDALLLIDDSSQIVQVNPMAQAIFGYSKDELEGKNIEFLIVPRYRKQYHHYRELFLNTPLKHPISAGNGFAVQDRNRKEILLDTGFSPIKLKQKLYVLITFSVASRRIEAEEALRASEERLRLAKQAAGLGIFDYDFKHNIVYWDEQMSMLWGKRASKTVSYDEFIARIHPEDRVSRQSAINRAMDPNSSGEFEVEYRVVNSVNGITRWIAARGRVYFENNQPYRLIGVTRDITDQKNLQKRLQVQRNETENIFKQQVASLTASAIAHELNQPLAAISAYSEVALHELHNKVPNSNDLKRALDGCVSQAQRAGRSLHELMAFLQKGKLITERSNLNELINDALSIVNFDNYGEFDPVLNLQPDLPDVQCNRNQVQKVLVNLFRNAIEAMHAIESPTLTITTAMHITMDTRMALVTVQDNGSGFDTLIAERIFEPFFTTKPTGIGMGLPISRALIEINGGQLWVNCNTQAGTKFHFTLPFTL